MLLAIKVYLPKLSGERDVSLDFFSFCMDACPPSSPLYVFLWVNMDIDSKGNASGRFGITDTLPCWSSKCGEVNFGPRTFDGKA